MGAPSRLFGALMLVVLLLATASFGQPNPPGTVDPNMRPSSQQTIREQLSPFILGTSPEPPGPGSPFFTPEIDPLLGSASASAAALGMTGIAPGTATASAQALGMAPNFPASSSAMRRRHVPFGRRGQGRWSGFGALGYGVPYGYGYALPYGGVEYQAPEVVPEVGGPPPSASYYIVVNGVLRQYDPEGNLLRETPLPERTWPLGGPEAEEALRTTDGHWAARLTGLQAADYTDGKGYATFWLDPGQQEIHFQLDLTDVRNIESAYIQLGDPGLPTIASPPVVPLYDAGVIGGHYSGTLAAGTFSGDDLIGWLSGHRIGSLVQAIDAGQALVVVHTYQHPQGELMGTIWPVARQEAKG